jgi:hypothetical protein
MDFKILNDHLLLFLFISFFSILFYLFIRDKTLNKNKIFVKVKRTKNLVHNNQFFHRNQDEQNNGILLVSLPLKPCGLREDKTHELPKNININNIKYKGIFDMVVIVNNTFDSTKIVVNGDKSFVDIVNVKYMKSVLEIDHPQISCPHGIDCMIEVHIPNLEVFYNKGSGVIDIKGIETKNFTFFQHGLEDVSLSGLTESLKLYSRSRGDLFAQRLKAKSAFVDNNGVGDIYCNVKQDINVVIKYKGNIFLKDFNVSIKNKDQGDGNLIYRPFEDPILNFIFITIQKALKFIIK